MILVYIIRNVTTYNMHIFHIYIWVYCDLSLLPIS